jgi:HSP20 family molecular chaperone IbpA
MATEEKRVIVPSINVSHSDDDSGLRIVVNLAGAPKETVELEMGKEGFCVKAEASEFRYETCFMLPHRVTGDQAKARFDSGLLIIHVPFEDTLRGHRVAIE